MKQMKRYKRYNTTWLDPRLSDALSFHPFQTIPLTIRYAFAKSNNPPACSYIACSTFVACVEYWKFGNVRKIKHLAVITVGRVHKATALNLIIQSYDTEFNYLLSQGSLALPRGWSVNPSFGCLLIHLAITFGNYVTIPILR